MEINKKEFFREFNLGDIYGLENLQKQLEKMEKELFEKMEKNAKSKNVLKNEIAENLCNEEIQIIRAKNILDFTIRINYLYIETQTTQYAEKYFSKIEDLYSNDLLNDLFKILDITNKDFEIYAK